MSSRMMNVFATMIQLLMRIFVAVSVSNFVIHGFLSKDTFLAFQTLYIIVPVVGYFFARKYLYRHSKIMILAHLLCALSVVVVLLGTPEEKFISCLVALFFMMISIASKNQETPVILDIGLLLACFVLRGTTKVPTAEVLPAYSTIGYIVCYFMYLNLKNMMAFLEENSTVKSFRSSQAINVNMVMMAFFMIACLIFMFLAPRLHIQDLVGVAGISVWNVIVWLIQKIDLPTGGYELEFKEVKPPVVDSEEEVGTLLGMGEGSVILDTIAIVIGVILFIGLIILAIRAIQRIRFDKLEGSDKKEFILPKRKEQNVSHVHNEREETTIYGSNNEKIRKKYKQFVRKYKGKENVISKNSMPETITKMAGGSEEITRLYEKARYGNCTITDDELKRMDWRPENGK